MLSRCCYGVMRGATALSLCCRKTFSAPRTLALELQYTAHRDVSLRPVYPSLWVRRSELHVDACSDIRPLQWTFTLSIGVGVNVQASLSNDLCANRKLLQKVFPFPLLLHIDCVSLSTLSPLPSSGEGVGTLRDINSVDVCHHTACLLLLLHYVLSQFDQTKRCYCFLLHFPNGHKHCMHYNWRIIPQ